MEDLNELAEAVEKTEDAADTIKQYEEILRTQRKGIIPGQSFQTLEGERKVYPKGKQFKNP